MSTYITLIRFTEKGIDQIKSSPARLYMAQKAFKEAGGELKAFYLTMGHYDAVAICEAPSEEAYIKTILSIEWLEGAIRTETLRGFTEDEYRKIIAALPGVNMD